MKLVLPILLATCTTLHPKASSPELTKLEFDARANSKKNEPPTIAEYQDCLRDVIRYDKQLRTALSKIVTGPSSEKIKASLNAAYSATHSLADLDAMIAAYATEVIAPLPVIVKDPTIHPFVELWNVLQKQFNALNARLEKTPSRNEAMRDLQLPWPHPAAVKKLWERHGFQPKRYPQLRLIADTMGCDSCNAMEFDIQLWKDPKYCHNAQCPYAVLFKYGSLEGTPTQDQLINHVLQCLDYLTKKRRSEWSSVTELTEAEKQNVGDFVHAWGAFRTIASQLPGYIKLLSNIEDADQVVLPQGIFLRR